MGRMQHLYLVLAIVTILFIIYLSSNLHVHTKSRPRALANDLKRLEKLRGFARKLRRLLVDLFETQEGLIHSQRQFYRVKRHIQHVKQMIKFVDGQSEHVDKVPGDSSSKTHVTKREVCPEQFMGKDSTYGYPFYRKGFQGENCTDFVPIDELVTMILTSPRELSPEKLQKVFEGIATYYPSVPVIFVSRKTLRLLKRLKEPSLNLKHMGSDDLTHGQTWSELLKMVATPYALFAPDITYFTDDVNLERLVRVLSENRDTILVGGSQKNQRGEWDNSCRQVQFRNWTAYFSDRYYHSFNDCVQCDVLLGPFMAKTKELQELGINRK